DRHGRRARRVHRPEPVPEPLRGEPEHRPAVVDVFPRLEAWPEDHLLPALAPGDAHREGHPRRRRGAARGRGRRSRELVAGEPRLVRGLPVIARPGRLLDPGLCLTLRPMTYPSFFEMYRAAIKNTWTVEEVDFATDLTDLRQRMTDAERHLVQRL